MALVNILAESFVENVKNGQEKKARAQAYMRGAFRALQELLPADHPEMKVLEIVLREFAAGAKWPWFEGVARKELPKTLYKNKYRFTVKDRRAPESDGGWPDEAWEYEAATDAEAYIIGKARAWDADWSAEFTDYTLELLHAHGSTWEPV